jgi:hypothetical protein
MYYTKLVQITNNDFEYNAKLPFYTRQTQRLHNSYLGNSLLTKVQ